MLYKKHTPGPWRFNANETGETGSIVSNQSHPICTLADPFHRQCEGGTTGNDGPLIAMAPEMLQMLEYVSEECPSPKCCDEADDCGTIESRWADVTLNYRDIRYLREIIAKAKLGVIHV